MCLIAVAALCLGAAVVGAPPVPSDWNENPAKLDGTQAGRDAFKKQRINRRIWNCYNYATNVKTYNADGDPVTANPGKGQGWPNLGKPITRLEMCAKVLARAGVNRDGLKPIAWNVGDPIPQPPAGHNLVAYGGLAGDKGDGGDYHWWSFNPADGANGSWSHKRGSDKAKKTYTAANGTEQPLTDPRDAAQRDGYSLCGFMGVPRSPPPDIGALALTSGCGPGEGRTVVSRIVLSGYSDPEMHLDQHQVLELMAYLPTFATSNEVPDPNWGGVPAGEPAGFEIFFDPLLSPVVPDYLRVFQDVVEVLQYRQDLDTWNLFHYHDDNGLEPYLQDNFKPPEGACCDVGGLCEITSPCTCIELGGTYHGNGVSCQDKAAVCEAACPWDLDGDGSVGITELRSVLSQWGTNPGGPPDFDGDGTVGITDFLALLAYWGACPL